MKATSLVALALLAASGLAVVPGGSAEVPLPTDIPYCLTPECTSVTEDLLACTPVDRYDNGGTLHTTVGSDCHVRIDYKPYDCVWNCGWHTVVDTPYLTIRQYGQNNGEASMSASAIELPDPCGPTAYCTGPECPALDVSTRDLFAYLGPHANVSTTNGCHATVQERGLQCAIGTEVEQTVGPATVGADVCMPVLDCTCPPMQAASASTDPGIQPPPQCLTQGCCFAACPAPDPVACRPFDLGTGDVLALVPKEAAIGFFATFAVGRDCSVDVEERGVHCPAAFESYEERRDVGPVGLVADSCTPMTACTCDPVDALATSASAALAPPIVCVMAPCGPQCLVPCVPQVVPSDCELRQATPEAVRAQVWGTNPYDCTVDVEPAYMCVGGWGFDRHVTAAFIDVTARVCTGGPFPPPIVQAILDALALE